MAVMDSISPQSNSADIFDGIGSLLVPMIPSGFVRIFCFAVLFWARHDKDILTVNQNPDSKKRGTCLEISFLNFVLFPEDLC